MTDNHSDQQLARGFLPFCYRRGSCEIRGRGANLWYTTAKALGFDVETIRCPDSAFVEQLSGFCPGLKPLAPLPGQLRRPTPLPDIIFSHMGASRRRRARIRRNTGTSGLPPICFLTMGSTPGIEVRRGHRSGLAGAGAGAGLGA